MLMHVKTMLSDTVFIWTMPVKPESVTEFI